MMCMIRYLRSMFLVVILGYGAAIVGDFGGTRAEHLWTIVNYARYIVFVLGTFASCLVLLFVVREYLLFRLRERPMSRPSVMAWVAVFASACFFYGVAAQPVHVYGLHPWYWFDNPSDTWALLPILAVMPFLCAIFARMFPNEGDRKLLSRWI